MLYSNFSICPITDLHSADLEFIFFRFSVNILLFLLEKAQI